MSIQASITKVILRLHFYRLMRQSYQKQRQIQEDFNRRTAFIPRDIVFESSTADQVPVEWVRAPESNKSQVILYFHGGAYFAGSIVTHRDFAARLAKATATSVLLVDYRLAPENPYPAAFEDATSVYHWLLAQGFEHSKIVIAGDSAGGGLTLATLVGLRDAGDLLPAGAFCLSPWTDLAITGESIERNASVEIMCKPDLLRQSAHWYVEDQDPKSPLVSPLYADLENLPPLLIHVGAEETLLDDSTRLAERARMAGVDIDLQIWPGMFHIFPLVGYLPEAKKALEMIRQFMHKQIGLDGA